MQHQGQIDAAKTTWGYDYDDCFKYVKEEIGKADIAIGNLEVTLGGKGILHSVLPTNICMR